MAFYFIVHCIIGFNAGNCANIQMKAKQSIGHFPLWVHGHYGSLGASLCIFFAFAAPVTTLFQWGIGWTLVTIGELILGAFISGFFPMAIRILLASIAPIISVIIMGALWGFWYI